MGDPGWPRDWSQLSAIEKSLVRGGIRQRATTGTIQAHAMALRWEGAPGAPLAGGYSRDEESQLVPEFADAAAALLDERVLAVHRIAAGHFRPDDAAVERGDLDRVLRDPATWIWDPQQGALYRFEVSLPARKRWHWSAYYATARTSYPAWSELSDAESRILVSATEASGMLTGPWGIWTQPDPGLTASQRRLEVETLLEPLLRFVRDGLVEVQYRADVHGEQYSVIPAEQLPTAFFGTEVWHDGEDADFGEGAHAVLTFAGYGTWHVPPTYD